MNLYTKKVKDTKGKTKERIYLEYYDTHGKRVRKSLGLDNSKANWEKAEEIKAELLIKRKDAAFIEKKVPTVNEFMQISFASHEGDRSPNTQNDYRISYEKHIGPKFGHMKLDKIKPSQLRTWQSELLKTLSPRRVKNIRAVLSGIINDAITDEIISKNPLSLVKGVKAEKPDIEPFSLDEIQLVLENSTGQDRNLFATAFFTGMRSGELLFLKHSDIDFYKKEIHVKGSRKMGVDGKTKTTSSKGTIDMIDALVPFLLNQVELTGAFDSYVFLNKDNEAIYDIKRVRETSWKRTLKKCGLPYKNFHSCRHSFATNMLEQGEDILWVSHMLRHTTPAMTLSMYSHYLKKKDRKRASFLDSKLVSFDTNSDTKNLKVA